LSWERRYGDLTHHLFDVDIGEAEEMKPFDAETTERGATGPRQERERIDLTGKVGRILNRRPKSSPGFHLFREGVFGYQSEPAYRQRGSRIQVRGSGRQVEEPRELRQLSLFPLIARKRIDVFEKQGSELFQTLEGHVSRGGLSIQCKTSADSGLSVSKNTLEDS